MAMADDALKKLIESVTQLFQIQQNQHDSINNLTHVVSELKEKLDLYLQQHHQCMSVNTTTTESGVVSPDNEQDTIEGANQQDNHVESLLQFTESIDDYDENRDPVGDVDDEKSLQNHTVPTAPQLAQSLQHIQKSQNHHHHTLYYGHTPEHYSIQNQQPTMRLLEESSNEFNVAKNNNLIELQVIQVDGTKTETDKEVTSVTTVVTECLNDEMQYYLSSDDPIHMNTTQLLNEPNVNCQTLPMEILSPTDQYSDDEDFVCVNKKTFNLKRKKPFATTTNIDNANENDNNDPCCSTNNANSEKTRRRERYDSSTLEPTSCNESFKSTKEKQREQKDKLVAELRDFIIIYKKRRNDLDCSQSKVARDLGKMCGTFYSQSQISNFENETLSFDSMWSFKLLLEKWVTATQNLVPNVTVRPPRKRTRFSKLALNTLQESYNKDPRPSFAEIGRLADKLDLKPDVVNGWFSNSRRKKENCIDPPSPSSCSPTSSINTTIATSIQGLTKVIKKVLATSKTSEKMNLKDKPKILSVPEEKKYLFDKEIERLDEVRNSFKFLFQKPATIIASLDGKICEIKYDPPNHSKIIYLYHVHYTDETQKENFRGHFKFSESDDPLAQFRLQLVSARDANDENDISYCRHTRDTVLDGQISNWMSITLVCIAANDAVAQAIKFYGNSICQVSNIVEGAKRDWSSGVKESLSNNFERNNILLRKTPWGTCTSTESVL